MGSATNAMQIVTVMEYWEQLITAHKFRTLIRPIPTAMPKAMTVTPTMTMTTFAI